MGFMGDKTYHWWNESRSKRWILKVKRDGEWLELVYRNKEQLLDDVEWFNEKYPQRIEAYEIKEINI